jgi:hypothetical protein
MTGVKILVKILAGSVIVTLCSLEVSPNITTSLLFLQLACTGS